VDPHAVLGLAEDERDGRIIRRAYARLLKQHRPDQDPEGFQRLHDAYQRMLARADGAAAPRPVRVPLVRESAVPAAAASSPSPPAGSASGVLPPTGPGLAPPAPVDPVAAVAPPLPAPLVDPVAPAAPPPPASNPSAAPDLWEQALEEVHTAAESTPPDPGVVEAALVRLAELLRQGLGDARAFRRLIDGHLGGDGERLSRVLGDADLLGEVRSGSVDLTAVVLRRRFLQRDWSGLRSFAEEWLRVADGMEFQFPDAYSLSRTQAVWLALTDYALARRLVGMFPARHMRVADEELDQMMAIGREMVGLPDESRHYLSAVFLGREPQGWEADGVRWRTRALLADMSEDGPLRRSLIRRASGRVGGLLPSPGLGRIDLLNVGLTVAGFFVAAVLTGLAVALLTSWFPQETWVLVHICIAIGVATLWAGYRLNRRLKPWYRRRAQPWLWQHFGPFDWILLAAVSWGWVAVGIPLLRSWWEHPLVVVSWVLLVPWLIMFATQRVRRWMWRHPQYVPPWQDIPRRIGAMQPLISLEVTPRQGLLNLVRLLVTILAALPAVVGATLFTGGMASSPVLRLEDFPSDDAVILMAMMWSGPWAVAAAALHAHLLAWWGERRRPWWRPLALAGWCVAPPAVVWLV
jgi:hypothetical protein